jgi:hypothetical protein
MFIDPIAEKKALIEKEKLQKKKEVPMIKLNKGGFMPILAGASI